MEFSDVHMVFTRGNVSVEAVRGVSLTVKGGEFVSILGPSGCGKSTLLRIAGGFEKPTSGCVSVDAERVVAPGRDRGMVFQTATLFPWKSVLRNVSWFLEVDGVSRRDAREQARSYLDLVGLGDFGDAYPHELSGGMRQRAALARTLGLQPKVLLMDEPFGALDALTRVTMQEELSRIVQQSDTTVVFVTHDIDEAAFLGDRVIVVSARPAQIIEDLKIDLPRPRADSVKNSPEMLKYRDHFWELLRVETQRAAAERRVA